MRRCNLNRRRFLVNSSIIGCSLLIPGIAHAANIKELIGDVFINNKRATIDSMIRPGDLVTTGHNGRISFAISGDAFLLKELSSLKVGTKGNPVINFLRLFTGKFLSVYEKGRDREIITTTATIGIRGTACFLNVQPYKTYFCTCYGKTEVRAEGLKHEFEATHHNAHELEFDGMHVMGMHAMEVIDHTDDELRKLESYVGRVPVFDRT